MNYINFPKYVPSSFAEYKAFYDDLKINLNEADEEVTLNPVFIILMNVHGTFAKIAGKVMPDQEYWHAALSFDPKLKRCYSFGASEDTVASGSKLGGFTFESIEHYKKASNNGVMQVSCVLLNTEKFNKLKATLDYYIKNKEKTRYAWGNLINELFGKIKDNALNFNMVCSQFVDTILKSIDINISGIDYSNIVKPDDLKFHKNSNNKTFLLYKGKIATYPGSKVARRVEKIVHDANNDYFA